MYVSRDLFERGLNALSELNGTGNARLIVGPRSVQFEVINEDALAPFGIDMDELDDVADDVVDVLQAAINRISAEVFSERRSSERPEMPHVEPEAPEVAREKFELVAQAFDISSLRARRWIKRTSKVDVPHALDWEIVEKVAASARDGDPEDRAAIGILRLASEGAGHSFFPEYHEVTVAVDREDLDFMIDRLLAMRSAWDTLDEDKAG